MDLKAFNMARLSLHLHNIMLHFQLIHQSSPITVYICIPQQNATQTVEPNIHIDSLATDNSWPMSNRFLDQNLCNLICINKLWHTSLKEQERNSYSGLHEYAPHKENEQSVSTMLCQLESNQCVRRTWVFL